MSDVILNGYLRVWTLETGANPNVVPEYQGCFKPGPVTYPFGDVTRIECPDPTAYNQFIEVAEVQGAQDRVTTTLMGRYREGLSDLLRIAKRKCNVDIHVHIGKCFDPRDFNGGWEKKLVFPAGRITQWSLPEFGALATDENAQVDESADLSAKEMFEIGRTSFTELLGATISREILTVDVCDTPNCGGDCGEASDGCQVVLAIQAGTSTTPGTLPTVYFTKDGGVTWSSTTIDSLFANEAPGDAECVGENYVVVAATPCSLHYADLSELLGAAESWTEVTTGFVASGCPTAISSAGPSTTWIVGNGGYVYLMVHPASGVTVQDAGVATSQNLADVHAYDLLHALAVGASNAVVFTRNGQTWQAVTGPAVGVNLTACWMKSETVWVVGDAGGNLWYTLDEGQTWTQINLPIVLSQIDDIQFVNNTVGWLAGRTSTPAGKILKTTDGGQSWYVLPEDKGSIPANDYINQVAYCHDNPNTVWGGGLADDGADGFLVVGRGG